MSRRAAASRRAADAVARETLGFSLRREQHEAVAAVVAGRDALVVMPTGAGKSAIYQVAGLRLDGPTVVVSPLIALQQDQVDALEQEDAGGAVALNSGMRAGERRAAWEQLADDELEFVFLAPEQLANDEVVERLLAAGPSLFVVDEAHCISEWGHDFRPEYLRLGAAAEALGRPTILALTATASPVVREEIGERLRLRDPLVVVHGFDRPNIWLGVQAFADEDAKREALLDAVVEADKPGIVYAATRRTAEEIAEALRERDVAARAYHAGLRTRERDDAQEAFMRDELEAIVATTAFGMGVDKANVRFVFHHAIADSVDAYYQEVGRAGRDGAPARALLFYRAADVGLRRFFAGAGAVAPDDVRRVADAVHAHEGTVGPLELKEETGLSQTKLATALTRLEEVGAVEVLPSGAVAERERPSAAGLEEAVLAQERRRSFDRSRVEMMRGYAEVRDCRREYLLSYFGEPYEGPCGNCDTCDRGISVEGGDEPFALATRVRHRDWGEGTVQRYEGDKMVVLFDEVGYRTLATALVVENGLLAGVAAEPTV